MADLATITSDAAAAVAALDADAADWLAACVLHATVSGKIIHEPADLLGYIETAISSAWQPWILAQRVIGHAAFEAQD